MSALATSSKLVAHQRTQNNEKQRLLPLVGSFEENVLNNRLQPIRIVEGYRAEVRAASGCFQPRPLSSNVRVSFYSAGDSFPYLSQLNIGYRGYRIPKKGTLQVTLFNPHGTLVKLFLLLYDLQDMPPNSQTFLRQKTVFVPNKTAEAADLTANNNNNNSNNSSNNYTGAPTKRHCDLQQQQLAHEDAKAKLKAPLKPQQQQQQQQQLLLQQQNKSSRVRYLIQLNIVSSKSGRIYLNKDLRIFISKKVDLETAERVAQRNYELKSFNEMPENPRYFSL